MSTRKHLSIPAAASFLIIIFFIAQTTGAATNDDEDFKWQEASKELDALPFSQAFIDSVKKAHIGAPSKQSGLRAVEPGNFASGETLVFEVGWTVFKAGYFVLSATNIRSRNQLRISAKTMTGPAVSAIYKVRNHEISWIDAGGLYPVFFEQHAREGKKYKADIYIAYDNIAGKLFFKKDKAEAFDTKKFTHDYISLIYYVRSMALNPGDAFEAFLFTKPKTNPIKFKVHEKRETIQVGGKNHNCVKVEPILMSSEGRVFTKKDKIEIWVTDDENHYPVMLKSKAKIG